MRTGAALIFTWFPEVLTGIIVLTITQFFSLRLNLHFHYFHTLLLPSPDLTYPWKQVVEQQQVSSQV